MPDNLLVIDPPNEKQQQFFRAKSRFVAYGGARGGGKSWAVRKKAALLALKFPGIRILLLRRSFPELRENHILPLLKDLKGAAEFRDSEKAFNFQNGSRLKLGYCDAENDVLRYQGQEYDVIFMDEATQFSYMQFITLTACLRGANPFPKRFYLTCNPGGVGHFWVKRLFVDRDFAEDENPEDYEFIPATVYDNSALLKNDTGYVKMLKALPEKLKKAWLFGDWNVFSGQFFTEFSPKVHLCEPFFIPKTWRRYFAMDYGLDMFAGYFFALSPEGTVFVYRELYYPNLIISEMLAKIKEFDDEIYDYFAPTDLFNRRQETGESVASLAAREGIYFKKAPNNRIVGWITVKEFLKEREDGSVGLKIFSTCKNLIRCLPLACHSDKTPGDIADTPHEITHSLDALRYFLAASPEAAPKETPPKKINFRCEREELKGEEGEKKYVI